MLILYRSFILLSLAISLLSCVQAKPPTPLTSTHIEDSWYSAEYSGIPITNILVLVLSESGHKQWVSENILKESLERKGVSATSGYSILPKGKTIDEKVLQTAVKGGNFDAVLIARLIDRKKESKAVRGYTMAYNDTLSDNHFEYYGIRKQSSTSYTTRIVEYEKISIESKLYTAKNNKLIWGVLTETTSLETFDKVAKQVAKEIVNDLSSKNLL